VLTYTPVAIKPLLSFKGHQKADAGFLSGLALLTCFRFNQKDKRALMFHLGFLAVAVTHYVLTDYKAGRQD
jgi:hypothetical protein